MCIVCYHTEGVLEIKGNVRRDLTGVESGINR
jgi:hypothetical protein